VEKSMDDENDYVGRMSSGRAPSQPKLLNISLEDDRNFPFCTS
jgi:hypothetical protein